jgi:type II secretory pathway pseudopilin PulG
LVRIWFHSDSPAWSAEVANRIAEAYCALPDEHGGKIIDPAVPLLRAARPNVPLNIFFGALIGAIMGVGAGLIVALFSYLWRVPARPAHQPDLFWRRFAVVIACVLLIPSVIAIIGMLAAIAIPNFVKARQRAQENQIANMERARQAAEKNAPIRSDYLGKTWFPRGDSIEIVSVERTESRMRVKGRYRLVSADRADLTLNITSTNETGFPQEPSQSTQISKGSGDFELSRIHLVPGLSHVSMYANGGSFAGVYFGTKEESMEENRLDLESTNAAPSAEIWSPALAPGEKPDLNKILQDAKKLAEVGNYDEALQRHVWYHNHALEYDQGQTGVRLSFALSDWIELGRRYPRAKQALIEIRDRNAQAQTNGTGTFNLFMDVNAINGCLGEGDTTRLLFEGIEQQNPPLAKQTFGLIEGLLVQHGDYEKCLKYIGDPQAAFEGIRQTLERMRPFEEQNAVRRAEQNKRFQEMAKTNSTYANLPRPFMPELPKFADNNFIGQTRTLIEILVATNHKPDAEKIQDEAVAVLDDARLKSAVSDAERKISERAAKK